jgi:predicted amidophosphoribosyltransferase
MRFFERKKPRQHRRDHAQPECLEVREEIVAAVFGDVAVVRETVSVHLEKCTRCREWETEIRQMHELCRSSGRTVDPSRLTENVLGRPDVCGAVPRDRRSAAHRRAERTSDRGVLAIVVLAVVLFQLILALVLRGRGVPIQAASAVAMVAATIWVYFDAAGRGMPVAFWTAVQPFTVPVGLVAYLTCRSRESVRCPGCGKPVLTRNGFCPACGRKLTEFCCGCGRPVRKEFRVCPHCGTRLEECFPREDEGGRACGWSANQVAFVIGVNAALIAGFLAALLRGGTQTSFIAACLCLFGYFPIFNWVSIDSRRRAMATIAWGILVLCTLYVGLVIYLACRRDTRIVCPVCGSYPPSSFNFCPCCGSSLGYVCSKCGASAQPDGLFCSACGEKLSV